METKRRSCSIDISEVVKNVVGEILFDVAPEDITMGKSIMKRQRVGISGLGILTSIGHNVATFSTSIKSGRCGIGKSAIFEKNGFNCSDMR